MITPVPMELVSFVILKEKSEEAASRLLALGVFHPVDLRNIEDEIQSLSSCQIDKEMAQCDGLLMRLNEICHRMGVDARAFGHGEKDIGDFPILKQKRFLILLISPAKNSLTKKKKLPGR